MLNYKQNCLATWILSYLVVFYCYVYFAVTGNFHEESERKLTTFLNVLTINIQPRHASC